MTLKEQIVQLNELKKYLFDSTPFSAAALEEALKIYGFKSVKTLILGFKKYQIIVPCSKGYKFPDKNPIYIGTLEKAVNHSKNVMKQYNKKYLEKKDKMSKEVLVSTNPIEEAIKLLKENGYKIYKPTTTFEEI